jgi:hypothetical protein
MAPAGWQSGLPDSASIVGLIEKVLLVEVENL